MKNKDMLSTRYAIPVCILLTLALIPTTIHSYIGAKVNDGKTVNNIAVTLNDFTSMPTTRNAQYGMDIFGSTDWFERNYQNNQYNKVRLFTIRSYDHKRLYHHPELALSYGQSLSPKTISSLPGPTGIPVHLLSNDDHSMLIAYVLLYDNEFVSNPINHQLGDAMKLLVTARKPMTLFYASQPNLSPNTPFEQSDIASLLSLAIKSFQSQAQI